MLNTCSALKGSIVICQSFVWAQWVPFSFLCQPWIARRLISKEIFALCYYTSPSLANEVEGVNWFHFVCSSVRLSVDQIASALYPAQYYPDPFYIQHLINQFQKVCCESKKFRNLNFCRILFWPALDGRYMRIYLNASDIYRSYWTFAIEIVPRKKVCRV